MLLKFNSSRASHSVSYHGKRSVRNAKIFQVLIGSSRRTTPSPVHTRITAVLYACVPVYARLRYEKLDRSNSSRRFPICTVVRLRSRSWCSHWTPSDRPVASRRFSRRVECELGLNCIVAQINYLVSNEFGSMPRFNIYQAFAMSSVTPYRERTCQKFVVSQTYLRG